MSNPENNNKSLSATGESERSSESQNKCVKVKKWNAVIYWSYNIENDQCSICHNSISLNCINCELEPSTTNPCTPTWGVCGHAYHFHCITKWLKNRSTCPLDDSEWDFAS